jgi:glycosyltransferase involved in cell wall biosynthesis
MRIGLFGGIANNLYVFAKALAKHGLDVRFVRDREDLYPMSQPVWEDVDATIDFRCLNGAAHWSPARWREWETAHAWRAPPWLLDPLNAPGECSAVEIPEAVPWPHRDVLQRFIRMSPIRRASLAALRECDVLLVTTIAGTAYAYVSGRPYAVIPHGGDIMVAAGLLPRKRWPWREALYDELWRRVMPIAYRAALTVGMHDRTGQGGHLGDTRSLLSQCQTDLLMVATEVVPRPPFVERRRNLAALLARLGARAPAQAEVFAFVPSRADFAWKGHDLLLEALTRIPARSLHVLFAGWGDDYGRAIALAERNGIRDRVSFLPCALTKPLLYRFFGAVDLVIDQFRFGTYGTAAIEAMGRGAPVMLALREKPYETDPEAMPPVLNAWTVEDIERQLSAAVSGRLDLEAQGEKAQAWIRRTHGEEAAVAQLLAVLRRRLPGQLAA